MAYFILFIAIALEVVGTMQLPATQNFTRPMPTTIAILAYFLSYASWAGLGVFSVALLSYIFYEQELNWQTLLGLFLIVVGVTIINIFKPQ
jgi:small multidrug resistance pump